MKSVKRDVILMLITSVHVVIGGKPNAFAAHNAGFTVNDLYVSLGVLLLQNCLIG